MKIKRLVSIILVLWSIFYVIRHAQFVADRTIIKDNDNLESVLMRFLFHALLMAYILWSELNDQEKQVSPDIDGNDVITKN